MTKVKFISELDLLQIIPLYFLLKTYDEIYYFDISKTAEVLLSLLKLKQHVKPFEFKLSEVKDSSGSCCEAQIRASIIKTCDAITDAVLRRSPFINSFGRLFDTEMVIFFFRRIVFKEIEKVVIFMNVILWHRQKNKGVKIDFVVYNTPFFDALNSIALKEYDITLLRAAVFPSRIFSYLYAVLGNLFLNVVEGLAPVINSPSNLNKKKSGDNSPLLGNAYTGAGLFVDTRRRCDFPWLATPNFPYEQTLIHFNKKYKPSREDLLNVAKERRGIKYLSTYSEKGISKFMPVYKPTVKFTKMLFVLSAKVLSLVLKEILNGRFDSLYYLDRVVRFIRVYSKSFNFYLDYNIKINIDKSYWDPYLVAEQIALRDAGGVSINVHICDLCITDVLLGTSDDIVFLFSPYYYDTFVKCGSHNDAVVFSGYITDYSFRAVRENSKILRDSLMAKGAKFIICYFDEHSSDDRMSVLPHRRSVNVYKKLLNWVISDTTLGLICSPKLPMTLPSRLAEIKDLIKKAVDTGRFVFMEGERRTYNYPTEAAQAADIVIGLLIGGTAALESYLSGSRVVYLDLEGLYFFPEYKWGKNKIVFDDLDLLISAINNYRSNKELYDDLGNVKFAPTVNLKDPFRDGKAAERIASYICWLLESFDKGIKRNEAIRYANEQYIKRWGEDKLRTETGKRGIK